MEEPNNKRWSLSMVVLAIIGSMTLLGYLSIRYLPSGSRAASATDPRGESAQTLPPSPASVSADWSDDTGASLSRPVKREVILHRNIEARIGNSIVTYRGLGAKSDLKLDIVILDLDPEVIYSRVIDIERAKNGFQLGDETCQLISARKLRLYVWYYD